MYKPISYFQTDLKWKDIPYNNPDERTTIGRAGCGPTSAAMVIATLAKKAITPVEAAAWALKNGYKCTGGGTYYNFFQNYLPKAYGIPCKQLNSSNVYGKITDKVHETALDWLKKGGWLIACMGKGNWTSAGHYIVVYGYKDGYVYINDPASTASWRVKTTWSLFKSQVKYYWSIDSNSFLPPKKEFTKETATPIEVMWLQDKLGCTVDGIWGPKTAAAIIAKRKKLGWDPGDGYKCTDKLIEKLV